MSDNTIDIQLREPVEFGEQKYESLTFRKMKSRDIVAAENVTGEFGQILAMLASMAGVPVDVMLEIGPEEVIDISVKCAPLMATAKVAVTDTASAA